jgi:hypothetical protein
MTTTEIGRSRLRHEGKWEVMRVIQAAALTGEVAGVAAVLSVRISAKMGVPTLR